MHFWNHQSAPEDEICDVIGSLITVDEDELSNPREGFKRSQFCLDLLRWLYTPLI